MSTIIERWVIHRFYKLAGVREGVSLLLCTLVIMTENSFLTSFCPFIWVSIYLVIYLVETLSHLIPGTGTAGTHVSESLYLTQKLKAYWNIFMYLYFNFNVAWKCELGPQCTSENEEGDQGKQNTIRIIVWNIAPLWEGTTLIVMVITTDSITEIWYGWIELNPQKRLSGTRKNMNVCGWVP